MELIKINIVDDSYVEVIFNAASQRWDKLRIRRVDVRTVAKLSNDAGVELIFTSGHNFCFTHEYIDTVGVTPINSNEELFNALKVIM